MFKNWPILTIRTKKRLKFSSMLNFRLLFCKKSVLNDSYKSNSDKSTVINLSCAKLMWINIIVGCFYQKNYDLLIMLGIEESCDEIFFCKKNCQNVTLRNILITLLSTNYQHILLKTFSSIVIIKKYIL